MLKCFLVLSSFVQLSIVAELFEQLTGLVYQIFASRHWVHSLCLDFFVCVRFICLCFHCLVFHVHA